MESELIMSVKPVERNVIVFSLIEAVLIAITFLGLKLYANYIVYEDSIEHGFYYCDTTTSFSCDISAEDGTVYPAGTTMNVYFICDDGSLGVTSMDGSYSSHGDYRISDSQNSNTLLETLDEIKQGIKREYVVSNVIASVICFVILAIAFSVFFAINYALRNKRTGRLAILAVLVILCISSVLILISFGVL